MDELGPQRDDVGAEDANRLLEQLLSCLVAFEDDDLQVVGHAAADLSERAVLTRPARW